MANVILFHHAQGLTDGVREFADQLRSAGHQVTVPDLFCSFCQSLKINPRKENIGTGNRPVKIVDGGAPVKEMFA